MSSSADQREAACAMQALGEQVSLAHFRLNAVIEALFGAATPDLPRGVGPASLRAVLRNVVTGGPMTVPQIAALRPVSRQYIQSVVDALVAAGLAEFVANPAHKRSKLVRATAAGEQLIAGMDKQSAPILAGAAAAVGADVSEVRAAADLLRRLCAHMDGLVEQARRHSNGEPPR